MSESTVAEYIKIRRHVIFAITKAGRKQVRIPSNRELERKFGVSRPTVQRALSDLIASGHLIAKPGIGTFTNPETGLGNYNDYKRIGLITGDGRQSIYERFHWGISTCVAERFLRERQDYCIQPLTLINSGAKLLDEIASFELSGVIWAAPGVEYHPLMSSLRKDLALPLVSIGRIVESVSSYSIDYEKAAYEATRQLLKEGRESFLFIYYERHSMKIGLEGAKRACAEMGRPFNPKQAIAANANTLADIERMLDFGMAPKGIIAWALGPQLIKLLLGKGIDLREDCRLVVNNWVLPLDSLQDGVLLCKHDYNLMAERAVANLAAQCEGLPFDVESLLLPFSLERAEDARKQGGGLL